MVIELGALIHVVNAHIKDRWHKSVGELGQQQVN